MGTHFTQRDFLTEAEDAQRITCVEDAILARRLPAEELLSTADVAAALNCSDEHVRALLERGELSGRRKGVDTNGRATWQVYRFDVFNYNRRTLSRPTPIRN